MEALLEQVREVGGRKNVLAVYTPLAMQFLEPVLNFARPSSSDVLFDIGCGDARLLIYAAKKYGCKCYGFEIDPQAVEDALRSIKENGCEDLVTVSLADALVDDIQLSQVTIAILNLSKLLNAKLFPRLLREMQVGSKVVSAQFACPQVADEEFKIPTIDHHSDRDHLPLYLYHVTEQNKQQALATP
eukprot:GILK01009246.1.p1 GENE.GILK01009246.1~~GILK01009246.1.p1  ORF type:complete len:195 (-),score=30.39 GILK01009246.1:318-878(-)